MISKLKNSDTNAVSNIDADQERLIAMTQSIHDTFPSLKLHFIERDRANQFYSVVFSFIGMKALKEDRLVMKGNMSISGEQEKQGYIEFSFRQQSFYRVNFYRSGSIRRIFPLMMDNDYSELFKSILTYMINVGYSEKDCQNDEDVIDQT